MVLPCIKKTHSALPEWLRFWFIRVNHCENQAHVSFPSPHYPQIDIEMSFNIHLHVNTCCACCTTKGLSMKKGGGEKNAV